MANNKVCSIAFRQALQEKLGYSTVDIDKLRKEYFDTVKEVNAQYNKYKASDAYDEAVKQMTGARKIKNIQKRRQAYNNLEKRLTIEQYIIKNYPDDMQTGIDRFMQLVHYSKEAKASGYFADFQRRLLGRDGFGEDYSGFLSSGKYDKLIFEELYYMDNPEAVTRDKRLQHKDGSFTGDPIAYRLADIIFKMQRIAVQDAIDAGADIALIPGYMTKQTHNMDKFLHKKFGKTEAEKKATWKKTIMQFLDTEKTFKDLPADMTPDQVLDGIWENITKGKHFAYMPEEISFIPGKNITKKAAAERKLFFKNGAAAFEYNRLYGADNLRETVLFQLENMANTTVLLNYMGTNPRYNFESVFRELHRIARETNNTKNLNYLKKGAGAEAPSLTESANNQLAELLGETRIPGNVTAAKINSTIRAMNNVAFLGGSLITAFMDLASSPTVAHLQGRGALGALQDAAKGLTGVYRQPVYREMLESIGFVNDAFLGQIAEKFSGEIGPSRQAAYTTNKFFQLNGLRWWTDAIRAAHTLGMSRDLAKYSNLKFDELNVNTQDFLKRFDITKEDWEILRTHGIKTVINGDRFMLNEAIAQIPDDIIAKIYDIRVEKLKKNEDSASVAKAARLYEKAVSSKRLALSEKLRTALLAAGMETVLLPTVTETGFAKQGTSPGTMKGEAIRHLIQFKQFPLALYNVILKGIKREYLEAGPMEAIRTGALFITGMMAMSYLSMTIKDLCNNRTPRDITDPKVLAEVLIRSGALSIYGDILLNDNSRSPYEVMGTLLGPTASSAGELLQIASKAAYNGDNVMDDLVRFGAQRAPAVGVLSPQTAVLAYANLFYVKPFLNYYIYDNINEMINPGYNARNRARLIKQGRDFIINPKY